MKRVGWVLGVLLSAPLTLYALDVQVNSSFKISGITRTEGKLRLPAERKTYYNVRVLDKGTYDFLVTCTEPCKQELAESAPAVAEVRPVKTREQMWIVSVDFGHAWRVTFLVFGSGDKRDIKPPQHFTFLDHDLEQRTQAAIEHALVGEDK